MIATTAWVTVGASIAGAVRRTQAGPADTLRDGLLAVGATEASLLAALRERRENDSIDFSDIPATTEGYWQGAVRGKFYRPR